MKYQFKKTYTIKEISKMIGAPAGTIKRWERDFADFLIIPRTKQGARFYSEFEIILFKKIKQMRDNKLSVQAIRDFFQGKSAAISDTSHTNFKKPILEKSNPQAEKKIQNIIEQDKAALSINPDTDTDSEQPITTAPIHETEQTSIEIMPASKTEKQDETCVIEAVNNQSLSDHTETLNFEEFFKVIDSYRQSLINEVKLEIRNGIRKEILEEVKKEISKGSVSTFKNLNNSIYKSGETTKAEIKELATIISKNANLTSDTMETINHNIESANNKAVETIDSLSKSISNIAKETAMEISYLSNQISDSSDASSEEFKTLIHYISESTEVTNNEIDILVDTLNKDREFYLNAISHEREILHQEIRSREEVFQDLVINFRQTAIAKKMEKKWWKFWS